MPFRPAKYLSSPMAVIRFLYHLPKMAILFHRLMQDRRVSIFTKAIPFIGVLYVLLPIDLLPEVKFLGLGYLDDIMVLYFLLKAFFSFCPPEVVQEHMERLSHRPGKRSEESA